MSDKLSKIVQWSLYILLGLSAIMGILFFTNTAGNISLLLYWGYFLFFLVIALTLIVSILNILQNPKKSIKLLIALALLIVVFFIAYAMSSNTLSPAQLEKMDTSVTAVRLVGAGLFIVYLLGASAIGVIFYATFSKMFK